ncbi:MAG: 2Fe-2S iron-sulfur cluster-binding protein [Cyanobacteria bacterium P01_H01_bin.15]
MPKITAQGEIFICNEGANLRQVLKQRGIDLHNGGAKIINCRGLGSCGTCAVKIDGPVSTLNWKEKTRLSLPPHNALKGLRLACQVRVLGDITVTKFEGFWGQSDRVRWQP